MKKLVIVLCLLLVAGMAFAGVKGVVNFKPYFKFDNTPTAGATTTDDRGLVWPNYGSEDTSKSVLSDWYMTKQDYWLEAFDSPSILDLGFIAQGDKFGVVFIADIRQDAFIYFRDGNEGNFSNIPFLTHLIELNFPRMGYIDYRTDNFYFSIGRRQVKWGPGTYDMAISDSQPYLDNFNATIDVPMKNGWKFTYNFMGIAYKYFLDYGDYIDKDYSAVTGTGSYKAAGGKSTFTHKFGFENQSFRIYVAELNMVYGKEATLLDYTPAGIWHNNFQDDFSNVMLNVAVEGKVGPVRAFGTYTMDDFDLPHERGDGSLAFNSSKPPAMGFSAGIEVNLLEGEEVESSDFDYQDYKIADDTFKVNTGLNIGYEWYYCTKLMYNRSTEVGKFTSPFQFISFAGSAFCYDENAFYLGFKYGPDTMLHRVYAEYTNNPFTAYASLEYMLRGSYGIESTYTKSYLNDNASTLKNWYDISDPITKVLMVEAGASYYLDAGFKAEAAVKFTKDLTHGTQAFKASVGASIAVCDVDWKNLFK